METDPKSCTKQILLVLTIWLSAYGLVSLVGDAGTGPLIGPLTGPLDFATTQFDLRTKVLLAHLAQ